VSVKAVLMLMGINGRLFLIESVERVISAGADIVYGDVINFSQSVNLLKPSGYLRSAWFNIKNVYIVVTLRL
jgi:hypothetical protein